MAYADFEFYKNTYYGNSAAENEFNRLSARASEYIDQFTLGKAIAYTADDKVKLCCCAVVDVIKNEEDGGEVSSQTVGPWTKTFVTSGKNKEQKIYEAISRYLACRGLLYRGL